MIWRVIIKIHKKGVFKKVLPLILLIPGYGYLTILDKYEARLSCLGTLVQFV